MNARLRLQLCGSARERCPAALPHPPAWPLPHSSRTHDESVRPTPFSHSNVPLRPRRHHPSRPRRSPVAGVFVSRFLGLLRLWRVARLFYHLREELNARHDAVKAQLRKSDARHGALGLKATEMEEELRKEQDARRRVEVMMTQYKEEAETLREALQIAAESFSGNLGAADLIAESGGGASDEQGAASGGGAGRRRRGGRQSQPQRFVIDESGAFETAAGDVARV